MEKEDFEKILKSCPPDKAKKGVLLFNGMATCAAAYQKEPTSASLRDWQKAEAALEEFVSEIEAVKAEKPSFKNKVAVARYLKEQNVRIGKSKLYKDAESGRLRVQPDGSVLLSDVDLYIRAYGTPRQKAGSDKDIEFLQKEKLELESQKLREQIAKLEWDREKETGKYILRNDFEMEIVARAAVFDLTLKQMISSKIYDWIAVCKGDHAQANSVSVLIKSSIDNVLNDYANTEKFRVILLNKDVV